MTSWPITFQDVLDAERRIRPHLSPTAFWTYAPLDEAVGHGIEVWVKHENHNPTGAFKARNGLSVVTSLGDGEARRGVVAATRGNHGQGVAWAARLRGIPCTVCVPVGNNPEKNEAMRGFGAEVIERGRDYDEACLVADELVAERGLHKIHSTNDPMVLAGAATMTLEMVDQVPGLDALVLAVGGGSQAVGALTVARERNPGLAVYGVQAEGASAMHDAWHAGHPVEKPEAVTFADGVATRKTYAVTFDALRQGLAGFITVSDPEIADALRLILRATHNLCEGAGAVGLAGLRKLAPTLAGKRVGVVLSGGNIDAETLRRVVTGEL